MGRIDDQQGALEETRKISADAPSVYVRISRRIKIWDVGQKVKGLCGGRKTENLIESNF